MLYVNYLAMKLEEKNILVTDWSFISSKARGNEGDYFFAKAGSFPGRKWALGRPSGIMKASRYLFSFFPAFPMAQVTKYEISKYIIEADDTQQFPVSCYTFRKRHNLKPFLQQSVF